jgi:hypothetical protein
MFSRVGNASLGSIIRQPAGACHDQFDPAADRGDRSDDERAPEQDRRGMVREVSAGRSAVRERQDQGDQEVRGDRHAEPADAFK